MSYPYQDPYYSQENRNHNPQQPYTDEYNPYSTHQPHPTYDQSGYQDDDAYRNVGPGDHSGFGHSREKSQFDDAFPGGTAAPAYVIIRMKQLDCNDIKTTVSIRSL